MATQANIRQRIRNKLYSLRPPLRPFVGTLNDTVTASAGDTTITVADGTNWNEGDVVETSNGEQWFVTGVAGNDLTVIREYNGTALDTGVAGDLLLKSPRFSLQQIDDKITDVLGELEGLGIYVYGTGSVTLVANTYGYGLTESDIQYPGVLAVYYPHATYDYPVALPFKWRANIDTTAFTQNNRLILWEWGDQKATESVYFTYAQKIDAVADLLPRQEELVVVGAAYKSLLEQGAPATHDPGKRTDRTTQPGQIIRDARQLEGEYLMLATREQAILKEERDTLPHTIQTKRASRWVGN